MKNPYERQEGGSHYANRYDLAKLLIGNNVGFAEGNICKYVCRHTKKNGIKDLRKAKQYLEMIAYTTYNKEL